MIIGIDTTDADSMTVHFFSAGQHRSAKLAGKYRQVEKLLPFILTKLRADRLTFADITAVAVVSGPGPFTATRVGVVTANTLGWVLGVPVAGFSRVRFSALLEKPATLEKQIARGGVGALVVPQYGAKPNITLKKRA
ncbi:MAG: hypothetical protein A2840_01235 [Candidatus Buchananbacteria bacterium RIFCSPHIGHO2_01_FULL_47_11b]|uniref:Gcp-like domain-containing protein n=1 Tax=Candidatus Buchananbacteria bacterium RIFCSPHIGHO2_01_FULL_47_11b TaxID=1797537 RepID=A0A1G1Y5L5_9BACT|nr:MAG: hypothetical protein A2840_01235 [Candidatus Buchananbacteria bacterium RIFCSPHIGHO2_01_FULL_47_11b]